MAHAHISANLPPNVDPTKAPLAFGRRALPKLGQELCSPELLTQQRALVALCELLHDPENVYQALEIGLLDNLKTLLPHQDSTVRQKATQILSVMATHNVGRQGLMHSRVIPALTELLDDPVGICRKHTHQILQMMSKLPQGAADILRAALIPSLLLRLKTESDEIQELILDTLSSCLRLEASGALATGAVTILKEKLTHPSLAIRSKAAWALLAVGTHPEGRSLVCGEAVPVLVSLLEDPDAEVQASAAGALMFATVKPQGRFSALRAGAIPLLLKLVAEENSRARLSALKALTMLAELPEGRRTLLGHTAALEQCLSDPCEAVTRAAATAIGVVRWKP
ncbi:RSP14 protein, partial [Eubucco bourcierii]|nr:RSP14 protein [Eubucco bourcierii]